VQNESVPRDRRVWLEAKTLAAGGHQVAVICPRDLGEARVEIREDIEIYRYPAWQPLSGPLGYAAETLNALLWTTLLSLRLRLRGPIDAFHAANPPDTLFLPAVMLRPFGTRFVFDQHDVCPELAEVKWGRHRILSALLRLLERASYGTASLVLAPNNSYRQIALRRGRMKSSQVVVVRNGPAVAHRLASPSPAPPLIVALAGILERHDGGRLLLDAAAMVAARRPGSIRIDIIGSGTDLVNLQRQAYRLGLVGLVSWAGWLRGEDYYKRLHSAHVGVSPDPDHPFSRVSTMMKVAEYLAGGMACVAADLPENRATAGDAALYFRPGDAADLARRLDELIDAPALLEELCRRARHRGPSLVWSHSAERLASSYRWLFGQGEPVASEQAVTG